MLSDGLKRIGNSVFRCCTSLQSIKIPSTVNEIGSCAFSHCTNLREVVLNDGLKRIQSNAFQKCTSLERITLPSTISKIDALAFWSCERLQSITIPSTITEIANRTFVDCSDLREVIIHNERVEIGDKAFSECSSLERFKIPRLSTRLNGIITAGQRDIEAKMDDISAVEWRGGELVIPAVRREDWSVPGIAQMVTKVDKEKLKKAEGLIAYYEMKEASTLFELALWKLRLDQADDANVNRNTYRIEVPGPVKDHILQYLR